MKEQDRGRLDSGLQKLEEMGCKIHYFLDGEYEIPTDYDLSSAPERFRRKLLHTFEIFEKYIRMPAIVDNFSDHSERRSWYSSLEKETYLASQNNRLRNNKINNVLGMFWIMEDIYFEKLPDVRKELTTIERGLRDHEPPSGCEENTLEYVDAISEAALTVLKMFENKREDVQK